MAVQSSHQGIQPVYSLYHLCQYNPEHSIRFDHYVLCRFVLVSQEVNYDSFALFLYYLTTFLLLTLSSCCFLPLPPLASCFLLPPSTSFILSPSSYCFLSFQLPPLSNLSLHADQISSEIISSPFSFSSSALKCLSS